MLESQPPAPETNTKSPSHRRSRRQVLVLAGTILLLAALLLFGRSVQAWWARRSAVHELDQGAVSDAQDWLAWSARFAPHDGRADVIRATCFRYQRQEDRFAEALQSAEENGAPRGLIDRETRLGRIQAGELPEDAEAQLAALIESSGSFNDVYGAFVFGYLYRSAHQRAKLVLDEWARDFPEEASVAFMQGIYWRSLGESALCRESFETAVKRQPRHELARVALADWFEDQGDVERAIAQRIELVNRCPSNETARLNLARLLRKVGRANDAQTVAAPLATQGDASSESLWELGEIALALGNYEDARRRFSESHVDPADGYRSVLASAANLALHGDPNRAEVLLGRVNSAATVIALGGDVQQADRIFEQLNALYDRLQRTNDLRARLTVSPNDVSALRQLIALSSEPLMSPGGDPPVGAEESGSDLYARHCAACHGVNGDGNGRAARHLYPRPKNLRSANYRLVQTVSGVPSLQDVEATIQRGMPGSSMPPFESLSPTERTLLAQEVLRLYRDGIRDQLIAWLNEDGDEMDEDDIRQTVEELTAPGEFAAVPSIGPPDAEVVARGREVYERMGCVHCHGPDGSGPSDTLLVDDEERLTSSRDLSREPLKGGDEPEAIYLRVLLGMRGTPHPACTGLSEEELIDLVQFCRSLRQELQHTPTNHERMLRATRGISPVVSAAKDSGND